MREEQEEPKEVKEEPKPIDFKQNILLLVNALEKSSTIDGYQVKEKNYPSDLKLFYNNKTMAMTNPTIVRYIAKAESRFIENNISAVIEMARSMIQKEVNEIKELLK